MEQETIHYKLIKGNINPAQVIYQFKNSKQQQKNEKYQGMVLTSSFFGHQIPNINQYTLQRAYITTKSRNSIVTDKNQMINLNQCGFIYLGIDQANQKKNYVFFAHFDEIADSKERSDYICNIREGSLQLDIVQVVLQESQNGDIKYQANAKTSWGSPILSIIKNKIYVIGIHDQSNAIQNPNQPSCMYKLRYFSRIPSFQRAKIYHILVIYSHYKQLDKEHFKQICRQYHKQSQSSTQDKQPVQQLNRKIFYRKRPNKIMAALSSHFSNIRYEPSTNKTRKLKQDFQYIYRNELVCQFVLQLRKILEDLNLFVENGQLLKQINLLNLNIDIDSAGDVQVILHISNDDFISLGLLVQHFLQREKGVKHIDSVFKCKYDIHDASSEYKERLNKFHQVYHQNGSNPAEIQNQCLQMVKEMSKQYLSIIVDHILKQYFNQIQNINLQLEELFLKKSLKESDLNHFIRQQYQQNSKCISSYGFIIDILKIKYSNIIQCCQKDQERYARGMKLSNELKSELVKLKKEKNNALHQMLCQCKFQNILKPLYTQWPKFIALEGQPDISQEQRRLRRFGLFLIQVIDQLTAAKIFQNDFRLPNIIKLNDSYKLIDFDMAFFFDSKSEVRGAKAAYLKTRELVAFYIKHIKNQKRDTLQSSTNSQCMSSNLFYRDMTNDEEIQIQQLLQKMNINQNQVVQREMKKFQVYMHYYYQKSFFKIIYQGRADNFAQRFQQFKRKQPLSIVGDEIKGFEYSLELIASSFLSLDNDSMASINLSRSL